MKRFIPFVHGQFRQWPTKEQMAHFLRGAGLRVTIGKYSVRVDDCSQFSFEQYGGDLGAPSIDASADSEPDMLRDVERVSAALSRAGVVHSFTVYDENEKLIGYYHHECPRNDLAQRDAGPNDEERG